MKSNQPSLIVINQTINQESADWLAEFTEQIGPIELWTGSKPEQVNIANKIILRKLPTYNRTSWFMRFNTWIQFTIVAMLRLLLRRRNTPVLAVTNPPLLPLLVWVTYLLQKRPYALWEWDIYPEILVSMKLVNRNNIIYRFWYYLHRRALRDARAVVTIGEHMAFHLQRMAGNPHTPIKVIPIGVDTQRIQPIMRQYNSFIEAHQLQNKFVVLYSGNIGATHAIETIIEVAQILEDVEQILFLIIGDGIKRKMVESAIAQGQKNIRLLPWQPAAHFPYVLASADIGIVTLGEEYGELSMPSKSYNLLAAGVPILAITRPPNDLATLIENAYCGKNYTADSPAMIAEWIRKVFHDPSTLDRYRNSAREIAVQNFDLHRCKSQLSETIYTSLISAT